MEVTAQVPQVFSALQKYGSGAAENYLTESFVFLLRLLLQRDRDAALDILNLLVGKPAWFTDDGAIDVRTQVTLYQETIGVPSVPPLSLTAVAILDIRVEQGECLVYIEVKHDSPLSVNQLEVDFTHLCNTGKAQRQMVLLSRSKSDALGTGLPPHDFHHICWYEIHNRLTAHLERDPVCGYFVKSFVQFLEEKAMSLPPIPYAYLDGVQGFMDLTRMLEVAIAQALPSLKTRRIAGWSYRGVLLAPYWCGFRYDKPFLIVFEENVTRNPGYHKELDLREVGFFTQNGDQQFERLVQFVSEAHHRAPVPATGVVAGDKSAVSMGEEGAS